MNVTEITVKDTKVVEIKEKDEKEVDVSVFFGIALVKKDN